MWHIVDENFRYYQDPKLTTRGYVLGIDVYSIASRFLSTDESLHTKQFEYRKKHILDHVKQGYTLVIFVYYKCKYNNDLLSWISKVIKAFNVPLLVLLSTTNKYFRYSVSWENLKKLITIKKLWYIGPIYGNLSLGQKHEEHQEEALKNGATFSWDVDFFGMFTPPPKPIFDMTQYINSKSEFKLVFGEPIEILINKIDTEYLVNVNKAMYQLILKGPVLYDKDHSHPEFPKEMDGMSYVFGPLFDLKEYKMEVDYCSNHYQSGFVDYDLITRFKNLNYSDQDPLITLYGTDYNDPKYLKTIREYHPDVVWTNMINSRFKGLLYVHRNNKGDIDCLVVDSDYLFHYVDDGNMEYDKMVEKFGKVEFVYKIVFDKPLEGTNTYPSPSTLTKEAIDYMIYRITDSIPRSQLIDNFTTESYDIYSEDDQFFLKVELIPDEELEYGLGPSRENTCLIQQCRFCPGIDSFCSTHSSEYKNITKIEKDALFQQCIDNIKKESREYNEFLKNFFNKGFDNIPDEIEYDAFVNEIDVEIKFVKVGVRSR